MNEKISYIQSLTEKKRKHNIFCYISENFKTTQLITESLKLYNKYLCTFYQQNSALIAALSDLNFTTKFIKPELKYNYTKKADLVILFYLDDDDDFLNLARYCYDKNKTVMLVPCENTNYHSNMTSIESLL